MLTVEQFIEDNNLILTSEWVGENPNMTDFRGDHFKCVIRSGRRQMTLFFSQGYGHGGKEPKLASILECLASDADVDSYSFEEWANNLGYDPDSRKAERIYKNCLKQTNKLKNLLGDSFQDLFDIEW